MSVKSETAARPGTAAARDLGLLSDIRVRISIEVGQAELSIADLLELKPGSVFGLNRPAGDPGDIRVNGRYVARGDILATSGGSGVKITEILNPEAESEAQL
jgi:flagellar motor switch protein FliN/FliY